MNNQTEQLAEESRPSNEWQIIYDEGLSETVTASSIDGAKMIFLASFPDADIHSISRASYVKAEWIGNVGTTADDR